MTIVGSAGNDASDQAAARPDPVIEAYKEHVDRATIRQNLRRSFEERIRNLQALQRFAEELRRAGRQLRTGE